MADWIANWNPIETAPLDGSYVIVWGPGMAHGIPARWKKRKNNEREKHWVSAKTIISTKLTHWIPQPSPPIK